MKKIYIYLIYAITCFSFALSYFNAKKDYNRTFHNLAIHEDSIKTLSVNLKELRQLKKKDNSIFLKKIDSLQRTHKIKDRQLNDATHIINTFKLKKPIVLPPDTILLTHIDTVELEKTVKAYRYAYNDNCISFGAILGKQNILEIQDLDINREISIIDFTRRKKTKWLFGLRLGRKETNILAKTNCGELEIVKYKKEK